MVNHDPKVKPDPRRELPPVDRLLGVVAGRWGDLPAWAAREGARRALSEVRAALEASSDAAPPEQIALRAAEIARELARPHPGRVVNATGILLHTNLGRAPLAAAAADAVARAARGYGDLELDLATGERGDRTRAVADKLRLLSGAADALAVNNNAAALLLALSSLGAGREVIVSRGELVEIGGSFRVPEIVSAAGVQLVEVGTTNRTHARDYERAIGPRTALLLKVHRSNFEMSGFVAEVSLRELAGIGARHGLPVVEDLGSGTLLDLTDRGLPPGSFAPDRLRQGADLVCFSADKLLGGPQAGIVLAARSEPVEAMRRNPLCRALRLDKLALAALDWTLAAHLDGRAEREVPVIRQLVTTREELESRARTLAGRLASIAPDVRVSVEPDAGFAGGGSLPGFALASVVVVVRAPAGASRTAAKLREHVPPVLARIRDGALVLDPRTLEPGDEKDVEEALRNALR
jgi:L-seryl-tRNA(Ser) seleniumtransferase